MYKPSLLSLDRKDQCTESANNRSAQNRDQLLTLERSSQHIPRNQENWRYDKRNWNYDELSEHPSSKSFKNCEWPIFENHERNAGEERSGLDT